MRAPLNQCRVQLHCGTILGALSLLQGCARNWEPTVQFDETPTKITRNLKTAFLSFLLFYSGLWF